MDLNVVFYIGITLTIVLALGLYITNIVFSFKYVTYELDKEPVIINIENTLKSKLIYEFHPKPTCEGDEEELVLGTWDGTINKCNCNGQIKDFDCTESDKDCKTEEGVKPKNYTVFNENKMCAIRGESYYNLTKSGNLIAKDESCPSGKKSCGIIDTFGRKLCLPEDKICPINKEKIINPNSNQVNYFLNEENSDEKIISVIQLSNGFPCMNFSEKNWTSYHPDEKYKNQRCSKVNGKTIDDRYIKFDNYKTNIVQLYDDNDLGNYVTDGLRKHNSIINLYGAELFGLDTTEDGFNYEKIISIQELSNSCNSVMEVFSYIMLGVLACPLIGGTSACTGDSGCISCCLSTFIGIAVVAIVIGFLVDFILCIIIYISVQRLKWIFADTSKMGTDIIKLMMDELIEKYSSNYSYALAIIIVLVIFIVIGVVTIVAFSLRKK